MSTEALNQPEKTLAQERLKLATYLLLPTQILLVFIVAFPLILQLYISFTYWTPLDGEPWYMAYQSWAWFQNYIDFFTDADLWAAIGRTLLFVAIAVPIQVGLGLALAALFYEQIYFRSIFYSIVLVPMMIVPAVAGYIFYLLFQQTGPINGLIHLFYADAYSINWLNNPTRAFIAVIIADVWQWTPLMFLILYAGLLSVPDDQMRAAKILGANWRQRFTMIALPRMKTLIIIALTLRTIECLKIFDLLFVMTAGGPGVATQSISVYLYKRTFQDMEWSYVTAIGIALLIIITAITIYLMSKSAQKPATATGGAH